jgi:trehalose 6-phosphate phosphatase
MTESKNWIDIFSNAGQEALKSFIGRTTLFTFDLDGTLAPIVDDPAGIMITDDVRGKLARLGRLGSVAILTGRSASDARAHLGFEPRFLVGNHGAEGLPGREEQEQRFARLCQDWADHLRLVLPSLEAAGVKLENKRYSLTLHYRLSPTPAAALQQILQAVQKLNPPPRRIAGKFSINLVPAESLNKGEALLLLMRQAGADRAVFIGDDVTDEDVFRLKKKNVLGIRVGNHTPSEADYCLSDQDQMGKLLSGMLRLLEALLP